MADIRHLENIQGTPIQIQGQSITFTDTHFLINEGDLLSNDYLITIDESTWQPNLSLTFANCTFQIYGNFLCSTMPLKISFINCVFLMQNTTNLVKLDYSSNYGNYSCNNILEMGDLTIKNSMFMDSDSGNSQYSASGIKYILDLSTLNSVNLLNNKFLNMQQSHIIQIQDLNCTNSLTEQQQIEINNCSFTNTNLRFITKYNFVKDVPDQHDILIVNSKFSNITMASDFFKIDQTSLSKSSIFINNLMFDKVNTNQSLFNFQMNSGNVTMSQVNFQNSFLSNAIVVKGADFVLSYIELSFVNITNPSILSPNKALINLSQIKNQVNLGNLKIESSKITYSPGVIIDSCPSFSLDDSTFTNTQLQKSDLIMITNTSQIDIDNMIVERITVQSENSQAYLAFGKGFTLQNSLDTTVYNLTMKNCEFSNNIFSGFDLINFQGLGSDYFNLNNDNCLSESMKPTCLSNQYYDLMLKSCQNCASGCLTCKGKRQCTTCTVSTMIISSSGLCQCPAKQYYTETGGPKCKTCLDKCQTCNNDLQCLTYSYCPNKFQTLNSTGSCTFQCRQGAFVNSSTCTTCNDQNCLLCNKRGENQDCMKCKNDYYLDLATYTCVAQCPSNSKQIDSYNVIGMKGQSNRYCRPFQNNIPYSYYYYVNSNSQEHVSLGTFEYPFKNLDSPAKEVYNFMIENQTQVAYHLMRNISYIFNSGITPILVLKVQNFTMLPYGDETLKKPVINFVAYDYIQPDSLLYSIGESTYNHTYRIALGDISAGDANSLLVRYVFSKSNVLIKQIDIQSLMVGDQTTTVVFLVLESPNKTVSIDNCSLDSDGYFLRANHQIQLYFNNTVFVTTNVYSAIFIEVIYTCTNQLSEFIIENSRFIERHQRGLSYFIQYYSAGTFILRNNVFDGISYLNQATRPLMNIVPSITCDPAQKYSKIHIINNTFMNLYQSNIVIQINFLVPYQGQREFLIENNTLINSQVNTQMIQFQSSNVTNLTFRNNFFKNVSVLTGNRVLNVLGEKTNLTMNNITVINSELDDFAQMQAINNLNIHNLTIQNNTGTKAITSTSSFLKISKLNQETVIRNFSVFNSRFTYGKLIEVESGKSFDIRDSDFFNNSIQRADFFVLSQIQRFNFQSLNFTLIQKQSDATIYLISAPSLNAISNYSWYNIRNISCTESQSGFIKVTSMTSNSQGIDQFTLNITDIIISNNSLSNKDNVILIGQILYRNLLIALSNLEFSNNKLGIGKLIQMIHNVKEVRIFNINFTDNYGQVMLLSPVSIDKDRNVTYFVSQCNFTKNYGGEDAIIQITTNSILEVQSSNFQENYSKGRGSVLFADYSAAEARFYNCNFTNNYAFQGGVFYAAYLSRIQVFRGIITSNFAVTGGVGYVNNNGIIAIYDRTIISKNQGLNTCMLFLINSQAVSIIDDSIIKMNDQSNAIISKDSFVLQNQSYLFMQQNFFEQMKLVSEKVKRTIQEKSDSALQIINSRLNISNCDISRNDQLLSASSESVVGIRNTSMVNIQAKGQFIQSIFSEIELNNLTLDKISYEGSKPFFIVQAENLSVMKIINTYIQNIQGLFMYVSQSELYFENVEIQNITNDQTSNSIFSIDNSQIKIAGVFIQNMSSYYVSPIFQLSYNNLSIENTKIQQYDKNLFKSQNGQINVKNLTVTGFNRFLNKKTNGFFISNSLVFDVQNSDMSVQDSYFLGIKSNYSSPVINHGLSDGTTGHYTLNIDNSQFVNNSAQQNAGAIQLKNTNFLLSNSYFIGNKALLGNAGAINLNCQYEHQSTCSYQIINSTFQNNKANKDGGAISYSFYEPEIDRLTTFTNNTALYGNNTGSYAAYLELKTTTTNQNNFKQFSAVSVLERFQLENAKVIEITEPQVSGNATTVSINFQLKDLDEFVILSDNSSVGTMVAVDSTQVQILKSKSVQAENGQYSFDDFIIVAKPGTDVLLQVFSDAIIKDKIQMAYPNVSGLQDNYILIHMRHCQRGEYESADHKCIGCSDGLYSLYDNQKSCQVCPENANCELGYQIIPIQGYWRKDINSTEIFKCFNSQACLSKYQDQCAKGYGGNLCQSCIKYEDNWYSREGNSVCSECPAFKTNVLRLVGVSVLIILYFFTLIIINLKTAGQQKLTTVYMRILTNYFQILTLSQSYDLSWETNLKSLLEYISMIAQASEIVVSQDCFIRDSNISIHPQYIKLIAAIILPLVAILIFALFWFMWSKWKGGVNFKNNLIVSTIILIFLAMPSITSHSFSILNCQDIFNDGDRYMNSDLSIKCWEGDHIYYALLIGIPIIVIWVIGMPLLSLFILIKHKIALKESCNISKYGFLYVGLCHESFYWEILIHFRKIAMISINIFFMSFKPQYRALIGFIILIIYIEILQKIKPYETDKINDLEFRANIAAFSIFYGGLFFISEDLPISVTYLFLVIILLININFWIQWFKLMFEELYYKILNFIRRYVFPCLKVKTKKEILDQAKDKGPDEFDSIDQNSEQTNKTKIKNNTEQRSDSWRQYKSNLQINTQNNNPLLSQSHFDSYRKDIHGIQQKLKTKVTSQGKKKSKSKNKNSKQRKTLDDTRSPMTQYPDENLSLSQIQKSYYKNNQFSDNSFLREQETQGFKTMRTKKNQNLEKDLNYSKKTRNYQQMGQDTQNLQITQSVGHTNFNLIADFPKYQAEKEMFNQSPNYSSKHQSPFQRFKNQGDNIQTALVNNQQQKGILKKPTMKKYTPQIAKNQFQMQDIDSSDVEQFDSPQDRFQKQQKAISRHRGSSKKREQFFDERNQGSKKVVIKEDSNSSQNPSPVHNIQSQINNQQLEKSTISAFNYYSQPRKQETIKERDSNSQKSKVYNLRSKSRMSDVKSINYDVEDFIYNPNNQESQSDFKDQSVQQEKYDKGGKQNIKFNLDFSNLPKDNYLIKDGFIHEPYNLQTPLYQSQQTNRLVRNIKSSMSQQRPQESSRDGKVQQFRQISDADETIASDLIQREIQRPQTQAVNHRNQRDLSYEIRLKIIQDSQEEINAQIFQPQNPVDIRSQSPSFTYQQTMIGGTKYQSPRKGLIKMLQNQKQVLPQNLIKKENQSYLAPPQYKLQNSQLTLHDIQQDNEESNINDTSQHE